MQAHLASVANGGPALADPQAGTPDLVPPYKHFPFLILCIMGALESCAQELY